MLKSHEKFHSANGKRLILVADDELINREILGMVLQNDYEVIYAVDGQEALDRMRETREILSLLLLDLKMPVMGGLDVLRQIRDDQDLAKIPVIVLTSEQDAEIESLSLGAIDFIPKPYPQAGVMLARILRTIELSEDRQIINSTERDPLTGLYNREFFYRYAEQFDQHHRGLEMDAIVVDINHFHMINERFGTAYGDSVLRQIGEQAREVVQDTGGIVCRREADTFMIYCPHREDYSRILEKASIALAEDADANNRVRLRMGVYENVDKTLDIERRFDRAKMAADTVRGSFAKTIGIYDNALHERELYSERLIDEFDRAVQEKQFRVYYQPKFDVRPQTPVLRSAEALVRWFHPELGMISPGAFIPLFEENGLIQSLDHYVWESAAEQIRIWRDRFGIVVPVSVNVSRIDMYDPHLVDKLKDIVEKNGLSSDALLLEITESAYTQDSEQIIETVNQLRDLGFKIEMDDFGTGYSSLNMISRLPIDALKLDMQFIRNAFNAGRDTRMLEVIIDIADYLAVPVIAEGVETEDQLQTLRHMGCDIVQGYYFSRPVPPEEYEPFLIERKERGDVPAGEYVSRNAVDVSSIDADSDLPQSIASRRHREMVTYASIAESLSRDYFSIYYVNTETDRFIEYSAHEEYRQFGIQKEGEDFFHLSRENIRRIAHPDDVAMFLNAFHKEKILEELQKSGTFTLTYRLMFGKGPTYVHLKATRMVDRSDRHIVIGVSNIDDQIRREQEHSRAILAVNRDPLTGVKSKYAYSEIEKSMDAAIADGTAEAFAVVVCDVNDLKMVNDTRGHLAGDKYLQDGCRAICHIFKHSPVFRVGGDEFAAILRGADYENRVDLMRQLEEKNGKNCSDSTVPIAGGMGVYQRGVDNSLAAVFDRADAAMYANKKKLKENGDE
ncbi:MAG: EAL domain-containing protein [Eubacteriales bacterium]|nr:EAL domain-containing protein [Eubacteriales bacterium]